MMRIPGLRLHDRTDREVTLICWQMACEALEKELGLVGSGVESRNACVMSSSAPKRDRDDDMRSPVAGIASGLPSQPNSTRRDALAESFPLIECGVAGGNGRVLKPHEAATIPEILSAIEAQILSRIPTNTRDI